MTVLGDILSEKLANDINSFVWRDAEINGISKEFKLVTCDFDKLRYCYDRCYQMLYNKDDKKPGRVVLNNLVKEQIEKCRAELLIRWLRSELDYPSTKCLEDLKVIINNNKETLTPQNLKVVPIGSVMAGLPSQFQTISIRCVMDACLDSLGTIDLSHLTLNFIANLGLWFTQQEMQKDLYIKNPETGKAINRLEVIASMFSLPDHVRLRICDTGLTFSEFKIIYTLKNPGYMLSSADTSRKKITTRVLYSDLTDEQLRLLSDKVLYRFQNLCEKQADFWLGKMNEIKKVAEHKGWDVSRNA